MSKANDSSILSCPIEGANENTSAEAMAKAFGGTYALGLNNKTWHSGIHFATDKPIVAVSDAQVVAYRFIEDEFMDLTDKKVSASFVMSQHEWLSGLGNRLTSYSLYMHLDKMLSQLIICSPSEWSNSAEKYASNDVKLQPDSEFVKKIIERDSPRYAGVHCGEKPYITHL